MNSTAQRSTATDKTSFAYKEGYYAFSRGWLGCKYDTSTTKGKEWQRGFDRAYFDNIDKLNGR